MIPSTNSSKPLWESFDEMMGQSGVTRPGWESVVSFFKKLPPPSIAKYREQAQRLIQQNGITYNIYGDPKGNYRPWELDLLPNVMQEAEWKVLEEGLLQRARLLDHLLQDFYGPMNCLKAGLIPPEIIYGFTGFLRPCHGLSVPLNRRLHFYAADVGRSPDGSFWIMGDKTQAPTGAGYALENRIVLSRVLDELFKTNQVHRLAGAFHALKRSLDSLAPKNHPNPRIVVLSPGTSDGLYFEHSYLARYLGYTLVQGEDLALRGHNQIFLKTLSGLQPIDVILRFLEDGSADPLELNRFSFNGVAGLVQAVRCGKLAVANSLGSGLLENPAFMAFLPNLCRHFLGEALKINSVATWWCGQKKELDYVLAHLQDLIIKPVEPENGVTSIYPEQLSPKELVELAEKIRQKPHFYVGQERIKLSTSPLLMEGRLEPRALYLRTFLMASPEGGFVAMPGGLARVAATAEQHVISDQARTFSKDTWVMAPQPIQSVISLLSPTQEMDVIVRSGGDVASRVADNLFWLGRYTERAEAVCRLFKRLLLVQYETSTPEAGADYAALLQAFTALAQAPKQFLEVVPPTRLNDPLKIKSQIQSLFEDGKISSLLASLYQVSHSVRDRISDETWMVFTQVNQINQTLKQTVSLGSGAVLGLLDQLILSLAAFDGLTSQSMSRGQGWRFLDKGRRLERALNVLQLLRCTLIKPVSDELPLLEKILEINICQATYRRRYLSHISIATVLDLILCDESHPRSVSHQIAKLKASVARLPEEKEHPMQSVKAKLMLEIMTRVRLIDVKALAKTDAGRRCALENFLTDTEKLLHGFFDSLNKSYLAHTQSSQQLLTAK